MGTKFEIDNTGKVLVKNDMKFSAIAAPAPEAGLVYFDSTISKLKISEDGSSFSAIGAQDFPTNIFQGTALTNSNDRYSLAMGTGLTGVTFALANQAWRTLGTTPANLTTTTRAKAKDPFEFFKRLYAKWRYEIFTSIDECNNSSYDTNLWETLAVPAGSVTETTRIDILGQGSNTSSYTRVRSKRPFAIGTRIILSLTSGTGAGNDVRCSWGFYDGTTYQTMVGVSGTTYYIIERLTATKARYWGVGSANGYLGDLDLSGLNYNGTINLHFEVGTSSGPSFPQHLYINFYNEVQTAPTTPVALTGTANGGTNYNTLTNNQVFNVPSANQGQSMIMKLAVTPASATEGVLVYELIYEGQS